MSIYSLLPRYPNFNHFFNLPELARKKNLFIFFHPIKISLLSAQKRHKPRKQRISKHHITTISFFTYTSFADDSNLKDLKQLKARRKTSCAV